MLLRHGLGAAYGILSLMTVAFVLPVGLDYGQFSEDTTKSSWENKCYPCTVRGLGTLDGTHCPRASGLQCYGCNIIVGTKYVDMGCSNPEVITCSHSHQGFKHRFCIKTESVVLGILLTSGCATSRHCQQQELPGVRIHCCDTDLCNGSPRSALPHYTLASCCLLVSSLIMAFFLL